MVPLLVDVILCRYLSCLDGTRVPAQPNTIHPAKCRKGSPGSDMAVSLHHV